MEPYAGNNNAWRFGNADQRSGMKERMPMHPDDFDALFAWIKVKRSHETEFF